MYDLLRPIVFAELSLTIAIVAKLLGHAIRHQHLSSEAFDLTSVSENFCPQPEREHAPVYRDTVLDCVYRPVFFLQCGLPNNRVSSTRENLE